MPATTQAPRPSLMPDPSNVTDRTFPLPDIDVEHIREEFDRQGFAVVRGLFNTDEMAAVHAECDRLLTLDAVIDISNRNLRTRLTPAKATADGKAEVGKLLVERFDPVQDISPVMRSVCQHPRLLAVVAAALGDEPLLFKDKLIFKLPGAHGYGLHQDSHQWEPFPAEDIVSVIVAIDAADETNGAMMLYPGYHKWLQVPMKAMGGHYRILAQRVDPNVGVMIKTQPGDVVVFHSRTPHRSGDNTGDKSRRQYFPTYSAAKHGSLYMAHYDHVHQLRRSERPGESLYLR